MSPRAISTDALPLFSTPALPFSLSSSSSYRNVIILTAVVISSICFLVFLFLHRDSVFSHLEDFAHFVRRSPISGSIICVLLLAITSFPPIMGYSTILYLNGYIYGFPWGWIPSFIGALSGSILCFYLSRSHLRNWAQHKLSRYAMAKALKCTIEKRGLRLIFLIRLAPYPYNFCNVLLATTNVTLRDFSIATAASLPKTMLHTYIGASVSSFTELGKATPPNHNNDPTGVTPFTPSHVGRIIILITSTVLGIILTAWLWIHVQRIVREDNHDDYDEIVMNDDHVNTIINSSRPSINFNRSRSSPDTTAVSMSSPRILASNEE